MCSQLISKSVKISHLVTFSMLPLVISVMGSQKGGGNQYIPLVKVLYHKRQTNDNQLPAFPLEVGLGFELRSQRCHISETNFKTFNHPVTLECELCNGAYGSKHISFLAQKHMLQRTLVLLSYYLYLM